jgi:hypothetical protein
VDGLEIKAPLGLDAARTIRLTLNKASDHSWLFRLWSIRDERRETKHAMGTISLYPNGSHKVNGSDDVGGRDLWNRILRLREDPDAEALRVGMVYKVLASMANYSLPYRGLRHLVGRGQEAGGVILMPPAALDLVARSPNPDIADPVALDTFLQVPGAFVHSLRPAADGQVADGSMAYICTGVGAVRPLNFLRGGGKYRAYTKIVDEGSKDVVLDLDAFAEETRAIIWSCKGLRFSKVPRTALAKALAAANPDMKLEKVSSPIPAGPVAPTAATKDSQRRCHA